MRRAIQGMIFGVLASSAIAATYTTPTGYWMQYSDAGQKQSIIKIWPAQDGSYQGKVITGFVVNGVAPQEYCSRCVGPENHQLIQGMTIMTGVRDIGNGFFEGGQILDPNQGSEYHVKLTLLDQGATLSVRGYILFPLLGRSQTWTRIPAAQVAHEVAEGYVFKGQARPKP